MTSSEMSGLVFLILGTNVLTNFFGVRATRVETATLRRICGRGNISREDYSVHLDVGIGVGYRREKRLCIGVKGI